MKGIKLVPNQDGSFSLMQERLGTPSNQVIYSGQGLFALCTNAQLVNASVRGPGIANWLNWRPSIEKINSVGIMTHVGRNPNLADDYTPPTTTCGDCETGTYTFCEYQWRFGEYCVNTLERKVTDVGMRLCEATPIYRLYGAQTDELGNVLFPQNSLIQDDDEWGVVVAAAQLATIIGLQMWRGTGAQVGVHWEMLGLETQNNTGWQDRTGIACPGADPDVKDYGGYCIGDLYAGHSICEYIEALVTNSMWRQVTAGLGARNPDDHAIWTYPDMAIALVKAWECCEAQTCEPVAANTTVVINAEEQLRRRRAQGFIDGMFLAGTINVQGLDVPVYGDLNMTHTVQGSQVFADIHHLVRRAGAIESLYGEYQDFSKTMPDRLAGRNAHYAATDAGRFAISFNHQQYCYAESITNKPRVIMRTPFLNGRITNVCAEVLQRLPGPGEVYGGRAVPAAYAAHGGRNP